MTFTKVVLAVSLAGFQSTITAAQTPGFVPGTANEVAQQEILFHSPAATPEQGMPIGNGRMGTLVWTKGDGIAFQLNRVDNFTTNRFHGRDQIIHDGPKVYSDDPEKPSTDQLLSLGGLTIHFPGLMFGGGKGFAQRLSVADGRVGIRQHSAEGAVHADVFVVSNQDVLSAEVSDSRQGAIGATVSFSLWRKPYLKQDNHEVGYTIRERDGMIVLLHEANEGSFHSRYAVVVGVAGRRGAVEMHGQQEALLHVANGSGSYRILAATASALDGTTDVTQQAIETLKRIAVQPSALVVKNQQTWFRNFWTKSFIDLHSSDGVADYLMRLYYLQLYGMASSSRGEFPPKFNSSLWLADQDRRPWGAQYWLWNEEALYEPLLAANHMELTDPFYRMYFSQLPLAETAARQRFGVGGAFYPETVPFDGPITLPETVAAEYREVLLGHSTADTLSPAAKKFTYDSQLWALNRTYPKYFAGGRYSFIIHILSSGSELAMHFWQRYEYSQDRAFLEHEAYPVMKDMVRFYMDYATLGADGRYHIFPTNAHESFWGARDALTDLAAIRGLIPRCIEASELLGADSGLRSQWLAFLDKLTPYPDGANPEAVRLDGASLGPGTWAAALYGEVSGRRNFEDVWTAPIYPFYAVSPLDPRGPDWKKAQATYAAVPQRIIFAEADQAKLSEDWRNKGVPGHNRIALIAALMHRSDDVQKILPEFAVSNHPGMGGSSQDPEAMGIASSAIEAALLQTTDGVTEILPAWPKTWDAQFELLAPGGFLVQVSHLQGVTQFVGVKAQVGGTFKWVNPWPQAVSVRGRATPLAGATLEVSMKPGETVFFTRADALSPKSSRAMPVQHQAFPIRIKLTTPAGKVLAGQLGNQKFLNMWLRGRST